MVKKKAGRPSIGDAPSVSFCILITTLFLVARGSFVSIEWKGDGDTN